MLHKCEKIPPATIFEPSTSKKIFKAFDKKYCTTKTACFGQYLYDCQATNIQRIVAILKKYEVMLNFNLEIYVQKPKFAFQNKNLNVFFASISFTY